MKYLFLLVFLLVGCSPKIKDGNVTHKIYEEPRRWVQFVPVSVGKTIIMQQYWHYDDEDWILVISKDGETRKLYVTEKFYKSVKVGDWVNAKNYSSKDSK